MILSVKRTVYTNINGKEKLSEYSAVNNNGKINEQETITYNKGKKVFQDTYKKTTLPNGKEKMYESHEKLNNKSCSTKKINSCKTTCC